MPILVRAPVAPARRRQGRGRDYSLEGLVRCCDKRDLSFRDAFARFSAANRTPARVVRRGQGQPLPARPARPRRDAHPAPPQQRPGVDQARPPGRGHGPVQARQALDGRLAPPRHARHAARWKGSPRSSPPCSATARTAGRRSGSTSRATAPEAFGFTSASVKYVEVTMVNASDSFDCRRGTRFSCKGKPKFDNAVERISARAFRA